MKINPINITVPEKRIPTFGKFYKNIPLSIMPLKDSFEPSEKIQYDSQFSPYLKDKTVLSKNEFTVTVEDTDIKRSLSDKIKKRMHTKKIYDFPFRLRQELIQKGNYVLTVNEPKDILKTTGLTNEEFCKEIDKINTLISLIYPRFNLLQEYTQQEFTMKAGNSAITASIVKQGGSGVVYKITVPGCKPLALKYFKPKKNPDPTEGAFPEIAMARKMNVDNVSDIPVLYSADPYNGWMLSDFVDKDYKVRNGISFADYIEKNQLVLDDINTGMAVVTNDNKKIFVDFGYISPSGSEPIKGLNNITSDDTQQTINSPDYLTTLKKSVFTTSKQIYSHGNNKSLLDFLKLYQNNPEYKLYDTMSKAVALKLGYREIPRDLAKEIQKNYEESGFIGDALTPTESCFQ